MSDASVNGQIDERWCYEIAGYHDMSARKSHGSHVLGGCLGYGAEPPIEGDSPLASADILFVQLPRGLLQIPSRAALAHAILDGVRWIIARAKPEESHIVINVSYGSSVGPHDGSSLLERGLECLIDQFNSMRPDNKLEIFLAAGNQFRARLHAPVTLAAKKNSAELVWRVPPASEMPAFMELWIPQELQDAKVSIYAPGASESLITAATGECKYWPSASQCSVAVLNTNWLGHGARMVLVRLAPTLTSDGSCGAAAGYWRVAVQSQQGTEAVLHAYIAGATSTMGFTTRGRQSSFVLSTPSDEAEAAKGTLSGFACGQGVRVVGGLLHPVGSKSGRINSSSIGPARAGARIGPDCVELTEQSPALPFIRGIGNLSGVTFGMNGTSVGAPIASRKALSGA
jgi:hypothetical protein